MASACIQVTEPFLSQVERVREEMRVKFLRSHQILQQRESALTSELDQLVANYRVEKIKEQMQDLDRMKDALKSTVQCEENKEIVEASVALMKRRRKELEVSLETLLDKMWGVELDWKEELECRLREIGEIKLIAAPTLKHEKATMVEYGKTDKQSQIIIHGTRAFKSSQLLNQLEIIQENNVYKTKEFAFYPFSDLNVNQEYPLFHANNGMMNLIEQSVTGVVVSTILILISQDEVFSREMCNLIMRLPINKLYGFDENNVGDWWNNVIVVFSFEKDSSSNCEEQVKRSIGTNRGIKEIVKLVEQRYVCISNSTTPTKFTEMLLQVQKRMKILKESLIIGGQSHSTWYHDILSKRLPTRGPVQKEIFKTFILLGERKSGKGSLGNLLLGPRESPLFATDIYSYSKPSGMIKKFPKGFFSFDSMIVEKGIKSTRTAIIQIVDQPEDIKSKQYGKFLLNCFAEMRISEQVTFLILIDLSTCVFTKEELFKIEEIAEILKFHKIDFFSNALIVFTHADEVEELRNNPPEQILFPLMKTEAYLCIKKLMKSIKHDPIFINAINSSQKNRKEVLHNVNLPTIQRSVLCHTEDDENIYDIGYIIANTLKTLNKDIYTPVSVILIDFERFNAKQFPELQLLNIFRDATGHEEREFWEFAYVIFKGKIFDEKPVEPLIEKVNKKYIWIKSAKDLSTRIQDFLPIHNSCCSKGCNPEVLISSNMLFGCGYSNIPPLSYYNLVNNTVSS